ncbi:MAG: glycoside hydrolase family 97 protein [Muribaculaceae bacterium]|nr:glycoside hydrolase family 97 protein [Muribaculaceae bacterium]
MMRKLIVCVLMCLTVSAIAVAGNVKVSSPDGSLTVTAGVDGGRAWYQVNRGNELIIGRSSLGFVLKDGDLKDNFKMGKVVRTAHDETWSQPWGEDAVVRNHYNEMRMTLKEKGGMKRSLDVVFRAFDDGVAFRYEFPRQRGLQDFVIMDEVTQFALPGDVPAWSIPALTPYYEGIYTREAVSKKGNMSGPVALEVNDSLFLAVMEANLTDYSTMNLSHDGTVLKVDLVPWKNGDRVRVGDTRVSPWRAVIIGRRAADLLLSRMALNLNEPCKIEDTSWVKPTKYVGIWWAMQKQLWTWSQGERHGATTANTKRYIDFAARHGMGGVLVEGWNYGWDTDWTRHGDGFSFTQPYPDYDLQGLCRYAAERGVRIIAHNETGGAAQNYENQMEDAYRLYESLGINTVKTGYVNSHFYNGELQHSQWGVRHFRKVIETAARHHLMIVNHEGAMPSGIQRTWPNLIGTESMRGQEYNAFDRRGGNPPYHECILPFTRGLGGPMDFTPGIMEYRNDSVPGTRPQTTLAHQLAEYVVIYSPGHMAADLIENYEHQPAFKFIEDVPTNWERTLVPHAAMGQYVTCVRQERGTDNWYVGSVTDDQARDLSLPLDFLADGKRYTAIIYEDGPDADYRNNPYPMTIRRMDVDRSTTLHLHLAPGGGAAIQILAE